MHCHFAVASAKQLQNYLRKCHMIVVSSKIATSNKKKCKVIAATTPQKRKPLKSVAIAAAPEMHGLSNGTKQLLKKILGCVVLAAAATTATAPKNLWQTVVAPTARANASQKYIAVIARSSQNALPQQEAPAAPKCMASAAALNSSEKCLRNALS